MKTCHLTARDFLDMLTLAPGAFSRIVVAPGPRERLEYVKHLTEGHEPLFDVRGYEAFNARLDGQPITVGNSGMYAPEAAVATEIFCAAGAECIIRTGSCGAIHESVGIGDVVIAIGAVRGDGTTRGYAPESYPAVASPEVTMALVEASKKLGVTYHLGLVWTTDAMLRETTELVGEMRDMGVKAVDMVTSSLLVVSAHCGARAGAVLAVSDDLTRGELGFMDVRYYEAERASVDIALAAARMLRQ